MDKIVITPEEVSGDVARVAAPAMQAASIPLWWRLLLAVLAFFPPVLFLVVLVGLLTHRRQQPPIRLAYATFFCWLLLVSGLLWMFGGLCAILYKPSSMGAAFERGTQLILPVPATAHAGPPLSAQDIAHELSPFVVVVRADRWRMPFRGSSDEGLACGAGVIVHAGRDGVLVLTSRHVVDAVARTFADGALVDIALQDGQHSPAQTAGFHRSLDLALLWARRESASNDCSLPIRAYRTVEIGEPVYVIGHPEGLQYSISSGIVAQKREGDLIQLSAPVSPGNSGGPVYDNQGNLIGIVQSVFDKTKSPNAENLNFAVRADVLLDTDAWSLTEIGRRSLSALLVAQKGPKDSPVTSTNAVEP